MPTAKWLVAGLIGGAIGVLAWVLVGYFTNYEVGWIAWGVGALAGIGVRAAARDTTGTAPGLTAAGVAVACVVAAKYLVVMLLLNKHMPELPSTAVIRTEVMIARQADKVVEEREKAGQMEERRVGKECMPVCRSRWSPYH